MRRKTSEEYDRELLDKGIKVKRLELYANAETPILHRCICGNEWKVDPHSVLKGFTCGCGHVRSGGRNGKTESRYDDEISKLDVKRLEPYAGVRTPILHCCVCGNDEWKVKPNHVLRGHRCSLCRESRGEKEVSKILDERDLKYERERRFDTCRNSKPLPFDFYIPEVQVLIEYHGYQHYHAKKFFGGMKAFKQRHRHDHIKRIWARKNDYKLIVVPYTVKNIAAYLEKRLGKLLPVALPLAV